MAINSPTVEIVIEENTIEIIENSNIFLGSESPVEELDDLSDVESTPIGGSMLPMIRVLADVTSPTDANPTGTFKVIDWSPPSAGGGEINTASNLPGGTGVFAQKNIFNLEFKSFVEGSNINLTNDANTITIATSATINDTDANLRDRSTHTGTQLSNTVSDFQTSVSANTDVTANTAKVSADGSVTTHSDIANAGSGAIITTAERADIAANNLKVTNANHTGDVTGDQALSLQSVAITGQTTVTAVAGDFVLISDTSDAGNLKKVDANDFLSGGGGANELNDLSDVDTATAPASNTDPTLRILGDVTQNGIFQIIDWSPPTGGGSGEINDGTNVGTGAEVFLDKQGLNLRFRSIVDTSEIVITQNANDLTFAIAPFGVGLDKITQIGRNEILGRISNGTGIVEMLLPADVRSIINVAFGATANDTDANLRDRSTHTGTQIASTISDFDTAVSANADVTANTAKVTNATHTGEVTGATNLTIASGVVDNSKMSDMAAATIKGREVGTGEPQDLTPTQVRSIINVEDGATADQTPAEIKSAYESNANTNAFTDGEQGKLAAITDTGSGAIITTTERANITDRTTHSGDSTYNDEEILFQLSGVQQGYIGTAAGGGIYAAASSGLLFDPNDGGILLKEGAAELYGGSVKIVNQANGEFQQALIDPNGNVFGSPLPDPGWSVNETDASDYDLGTGTTAGIWIELAGLNATIPQAITSGERLDFYYSVYAQNKTENRNGTVEFGYTVNDPTPPTLVSETNAIPNNFEGFLNGSGTTSTLTAGAGEIIRLWARINNGSNSAFGVDLLGTTAEHEVTYSTAASGGGGANQLNDLTDVNTTPLGDSSLGKIRILADVTSVTDNTTTGTYKPIDLALRDSYAWFMPAVENKTYVLDQSAAYPTDIISLTSQATSGSCSLTVAIDGVNVTGLVNVTADAIERVDNASASLSIPAGGRLTITVSGNSSIVDLAFTLATIRT